jgi:hypothetical protein
VAPIVTIAGGATATTTDLDPTITGSSNAAPGTTVTVSIKGQTITTLLQADGTWNATPSRVGDGSWPIVASDSDPAGNLGSARQILTVGAEIPTTPGSPAAGVTGSAASPVVTVECAAAKSGARCKGLLSATSRVTTRGGKPQKVTAAAVAQASKRAKGSQPKMRTALVVVASGSYSLAPGQHATFTLALNKHGQKLLKRFHRVPATLKITGGAISATRTITFGHTRVRADAPRA